MTKAKEDTQEWFNTAFKSATAALAALAIWVFNNNSRSFDAKIDVLNENIKGLTIQLRDSQVDSAKHFTEYDKRLSAIEVARSISMPGYEKLQSDVQDIKARQIQMDARTQTISDFMVKHFK